MNKYFINYDHCILYIHRVTPWTPHFDVICASLAMKTSTHYYYTTYLEQISTHLIQIIYIIIYLYKIAILHHGMQSFHNNCLLHACLLHARLLHGCDVTHISSIGRFATSISLREHANERYAECLGMNWCSKHLIIINNPTQNDLFTEIDNFIEVYNNSVIELIQCFGTSFFGRIDHLASSVIKFRPKNSVPKHCIRSITYNYRYTCI